MKKPICLASCLLALTLTSTFSQQPIATGTISVTPSNSQSSQPGLTKFNLDFPGGTPKQLVAAIEKATGKTLNAIVPDEYADTQLPPIKVNNVTVPQLFSTLLEGSYKYIQNSSTRSQEISSSYGFKTIATPSDDAIWTFFVYKMYPTTTGLTKFSLDFPGGTPKELVTAIQKATGKPLNVIIPDEFSGTKLPPLKMKDVDVSKLFRTLEISSSKTVAYVTGTTTDGSGTTRSTYQQSQTAYGFRTEGSLSDDSVWYFRVDGSNLPLLYQAKVSRYYSLTPYLDQGFTVDDITTAIQTGWKMQGDDSIPQVSFHKETKLLIAVGEPNKLDTIDAVLKALDTPKPKVPSRPVKPVEQSKPVQE